MALNTHDMICVTCERALKKTKAGVKLRVESMNGHQRGDLWECKGCGVKVLSGFSQETGFGQRNEDIYIDRLW